MRYSGPVLPEPSLVSETPQGFSQSLTVGLQFESQAKLTQIFLRADCSERAKEWDGSRCENVPCWNSQVKKKKNYTHKDLSCLHWHRHSCLLLHNVFCYFLHLDSISCFPARYCYITQSMAENVFSFSDMPHHFFMEQEVGEENARLSAFCLSVYSVLMLPRKNVQWK